MAYTSAKAPALQSSGGSKRGSSLPVRVGGKLGQYQVSFEIARGGMATVYLACVLGRAGMNRFVALKCLRPELARDQSFIDMFFDEARIVSQIHHPNVCSVLDFDAKDDVHFLALEFLSGQTLTKVLRELHLRPNRFTPQHQAGLVCRLLTDACEGLHAAHELTDARGEAMNIVHRDVAPDNLFVTYDGALKVLDFGVASASHQHHRTSTGLIKGKCSYLSPEVLKGERPDRRADVWGLGVTAWEMLTHKKLFKGDTDIETFRGISGGSIPKPTDVCPTCPPALDDVVMRALRREPDARYETAREMGKAFQGYLAENKLSIGLAEVAETMGELFPAGRACNRKLFEVAQQIENDPAAATPFDPMAVEVSAGQLISIPRLPPRPPEPALAGWRQALAASFAVAALSVLLAGAALYKASGGSTVGPPPPALRLVPERPPPSAAQFPLAPHAPLSPPSPLTPPGQVGSSAAPPSQPTGLSPSSPWGLEVDPLVADSSGDLVLRLRVSAR